RRYADCLAMHADLEEYIAASRQPVSVLQLAQLVEKHRPVPGKPVKRAPPPAAPPPVVRPPVDPSDLPTPRPEITTVTSAGRELRKLLQPEPVWPDASTETTEPQLRIEIPPPPPPKESPAPPPEALRPARQRPDDLRWDVVEEHLDEASFLHGQWEEALRSPGYTLAAIAGSPERRLLAHLGGLVLGGPRVAERLLAPALASDEPGTVFAAAFALLEGGRPADFEALVGALEEGDPVQRAAICRAMAVVPRDDLGRQLTPLLEKVPALRTEVLEVLGQLRVDPGLPLDPLASSGKPSMEVLALRLAQVAPDRLEPAAVERAYASPVPDVCAAGFETGLMTRSRDAFAACESAVEARSPGFSTAALLLGLSGDDKSVATLLQALADRDFQRDVVFALGFSGRVSAADALLAAMEDETLAPLVAEAFAAITGLRVEKEMAVRLDRWGPEVKADDDGVERSRSEAALAQPDPDEVARWWKEARPKLDPARRWLRGQRWSTEALLDELEHGPARRREALALDVAVRTRGQVQISWNGLSSRQHRELGEARIARRQIHEGSYRDFNRGRP
ncbi:MAG TPA: TIGR02270 family protein, partial [Myxococcales bacterium]|nr:TIGR02270 family protein [Myxococcales bacterium]